VTASDYVVELSDVQPSEVRLVIVELQAQKHWRHRGTVGVSAGNDALEVQVTTWHIP
jgi:hypothetical protein